MFQDNLDLGGEEGCLNNGNMFYILYLHVEYYNHVSFYFLYISFSSCLEVGVEQLNLSF